MLPFIETSFDHCGVTGNSMAHVQEATEKAEVTQEVNQWIHRQKEAIQKYLQNEIQNDPELHTVGCIETRIAYYKEYHTIAVYCLSTGDGKSFSEPERHKFVVYCIREKADPYPIFETPLSKGKAASCEESREYIKLKQFRRIDDFGINCIGIEYQGNPYYLSVESIEEFYGRVLTNKNGKDLLELENIEIDHMRNTALVYQKRITSDGIEQGYHRIRRVLLPHAGVIGGEIIDQNEENLEERM